MPALIRSLALVAFASVLAAPASSQLLQRRDLSYSMAVTIAQGAVAGRPLANLRATHR